LLETIAAGGSFNANYIATRMQGIDPKEAAGKDAKLAIEVIQHLGAIMKDVVNGTNRAGIIALRAQ